MKKKGVWQGLAVLTGFLLFLVSFIGFGALWGLTTWGEIDIDEIIFQLQMPLEGTGNGMLLDYAVKGILPVFFVVGAYILLAVRSRNSRYRMRVVAGCLAAVLLSVVLIRRYVWERLHVEEWFAGQADQSMFIQDNYVSTADVKLTFPEQKRNLIYIYLESMEVTFADRDSGGAFPENVIPELTALARDNEDFSGSSDALNGGIVYVGTSFTTGGMFAQTTGLPLKISIGKNNMDTQESFFPGIKGLGDILQEEGYKQVLMIGSNATFGGRRLYYREHGDFEIDDYLYAKEQGWIPEDYKVFWGYEDEKLFAFAKKRLTEMAAEDAPFHLTLLTVDTHFEDGYVCRLCKDEFGENQYANVIACSSRQVAAFVDWIRKQDFFENTTVILAGDHTTMDKDFCAEIDSSYRRKAYVAYINAAAQPADPAKTRTYATLDAFPTTLAALGVQIEGNRLGLGTNLFSEKETLSEKYGDYYERVELGKRSAFLEYLEKTDDSPEVLLERLQTQMKNALQIDSCDSATGKVRIRVKNDFDSGLKAESMEAQYRENGSSAVSTVLLEPDPDDGTWMVGTLDVSGWKTKKGEVIINATLETNGKKYENVVSGHLE
ncbi:MAG: sulfatase-like hydrolase/transferase [Lachnospiraceae bacterium]|nr:sulfatase-like hydrolase/transferase [Lachnospiraceae bacterium]